MNEGGMLWGNIYLYEAKNFNINLGSTKDDCESLLYFRKQCLGSVLGSQHSSGGLCRLILFKVGMRIFDSVHTNLFKLMLFVGIQRK